MKKYFLVLLSCALIFSLWACQKKEEPAPAAKSPAPSGPILDSPVSPQGHGSSGQKPEFQVVVPPDVQEMWLGVTIVVQDKQENKEEEFNVNIGGEFAIPDSTLTVRVGPFLPDFKMSGTVITSASNDPNNPSVGVAIIDDGKKVFPSSGEWGWLYAKFPTIHSFQHERYALNLKAGTKKE
jgi:hypothetical protein